MLSKLLQLANVRIRFVMVLLPFGRTIFLSAVQPLK